MLPVPALPIALPPPRQTPTTPDTRCAERPPRRTPTTPNALHTDAHHRLERSNSSIVTDRTDAVKMPACSYGVASLIHVADAARWAAARIADICTPDQGCRYPR